MSCLETYATLRIFSQTLDPSEISRILDLDATRSKPLDPASKYRPRRENHFWAWCTRTIVDSKDGLEHVRTVILTLAGKEQELGELRKAGCDIDVCCYWSSSGQGGPFLDVAALTGLARLGLEICWDVYFSASDDRHDIAGGT